MGYSAWFDCSALHRFLASAGAETAWFDCEKVESSEKVGAGGFAVDLGQVEHMERLVEIGTDHDGSGLVGLATRLVRNRLQQDSVMHN